MRRVLDYYLGKRSRSPVSAAPSGLPAVTLVEVLVCILILGFAVASIFAAWQVGDDSWSIDMGMLDLRQGSRLAVDGMLREIRGAESTDITITGAGDRVDFTLSGISGNTISYYIDGATNRLVREHPVGTNKILAQDISDIDFSCCQGGVCTTVCGGKNAFKIELQADKTVKGKPLSFSLAGKVRLRNE